MENLSEVVQCCVCHTISSYSFVLCVFIIFCWHATHIWKLTVAHFFFFSMSLSDDGTLPSFISTDPFSIPNPVGRNKGTANSVFPAELSSEQRKCVSVCVLPFVLDLCWLFIHHACSINKITSSLNVVLWNKLKSGDLTLSS